MAENKGDKPGLKLTREKKGDKPPVAKHKEDSPDVSAGPIIKFLELVFNPSDDKLREVTIIDRRQGRLLPQQDIINTLWEYVIEVATYRKDSVAYAEVYGRPYPIEPQIGALFVKRTAQWGKSINGVNLGKAVDIALAEMETRVDEDEEGYGTKPEPYGD